MMKCGPPEQAVIPSIAHSGGKVKGGGGPGRAALAFPILTGPPGLGTSLLRIGEPGTCHAQHACFV